VRLAPPPTSPAAPRPVLSGAVGLIAGFLLAVVVVMLLEFADRRIKDEDETQAVFGLPMLAQIPRPPRSLRPASGNSDPLQDEGYANLAASVLFSPNKPRSLLVTSPSAGDGKTTVTFGLARALTRLGKSVIIIGANLGHPRADQHTEVGRGGGLTAVLTGLSEVADELVEMNAISTGPIRGSKGGEVFSFSRTFILPAWGLAPQMLLSPTMAPVIEECRSIADFVLIDTPPVGVVHDAIMLVDFADAVLLVSRLSWTTKDAARRALRVLRPRGAPVLGIVVTGGSRPEGYPYRGSRYEPDQAVAEALHTGDGR
jgi:Mrp family chromosome partitioning ATPase